MAMDLTASQLAGLGIAKQAYAPGETKPEQSAISSAEYALEQARELSTRIQVLADRMLGSRPPELTAAGKIGVEPMGVFPILQSSSDRTSSAIADGFNALQRIERSLP